MRYSKTQSPSSTTLRLESMAIEMPSIEGHPNRVGFRGVLTFVEVPSDKAPAGAQGHRVLLTRTATEQALPSLLGMALDYAPTLDRHDARRKVGIITRAELLPAMKASLSGRGSPSSCNAGRRAPHRALAEELRAGAISDPPGKPAGAGTPAAATPQVDVRGYIFARDFPELIGEMRKGGSRFLGMSYEITDARIEDPRASIWTINEFLFTGAQCFAVTKRPTRTLGFNWNK